MNRSIEDMHMIEIELFNECNRRCEWCLLGHYGPGKYQILDMDSFKRILEELRDAGFEKKNKRVIVFSGFYEPMMDMEILTQAVRLTKKIMPDVGIKINSNGDYMTKENADRLSMVNEIIISDYDCINSGDEYFVDLGFIPINKVRGYRRFVNEKSNLLIKYRPNTPLNLLMEDRGGTLPDIVINNELELKWNNERAIREHPCTEALVSICIGSDGSVYPCCHVRNNVPFHVEYVLGNINESTLSEIIEGEKYDVLTDRLMSDEYDKAPIGCRRCQKRIQKGMYYHDHDAKGHFSD